MFKSINVHVQLFKYNMVFPKLQPMYPCDLNIPGSSLQATYDMNEYDPPYQCQLPLYTVHFVLLLS